MILEICTGTPAGLAAAQRGGAQRVELCSALSEGGLTPSMALIRMACRMSSITTHVLVRPRSGDFLYSTEEQALILKDIEIAVNEGAAGVVVGGLTSEGDVDMDFLRCCVAAASGASVTFHRAFDLCREPFRALNEIIDCGCNRLLTSGQAPTAEAGIPLIAQLVECAGNHLSILPGCGVNPKNAKRILVETGAREIHASARKVIASRMRMIRKGVAMGKLENGEYARLETSESVVREIFNEISEVCYMFDKE